MTCQETAHLESLIREDFERCHPGETLADLKRRASFSKEDRGLLRDWMAVGRSRRSSLCGKGIVTTLGVNPQTFGADGSAESAYPG
ncbi:MULTISPECIES: hypothetical protein [unclassified Bradyrhizobium]|uniref:hypothetical protein n=1 Tax=Bradyrhizobium sp. Leo121 TaxID=1571195 RepID=UPI000559477C|nr:hypothetical protein [Bradyrhizobium sp. Leo121]RZN31940.1 hypothetical protein CWO90_15135 [Bradyrhizobium sp. Leo121]